MSLSNNNTANNQVSSNSTMNSQSCCVVCGKNLINNPDDGLIILKNNEQHITEDVVLVCRGACDRKLDDHFWIQGYTTGTKEMNTGFKNWYVKPCYTEKAIEKYKDIVAKL